MNDLVLVPWSVNQSPIRVVIIIIMDHSYNNNNKWRSDATFSDPRVWINHGSTMDQHGSTWINCHSACPPWLMRHGSRLMAHASWLTSHASHSRGMAHASCVMVHVSHSRGMAHVSHSRGMAHASCVLTHGSCVMRPRIESVQPPPIQPPPIQPPPIQPPPIQPPPVVGHDDNNRRRSFIHASPIRFAPVELYSMG